MGTHASTHTGHAGSNTLHLSQVCRWIALLPVLQCTLCRSRGPHAAQGGGQAHTQMHARTYTCMHIYTCSHTRMHAHTYTRAHTHACTHMHTRMHAHTYTRAHTHACTHMHTRMHAHTHTHTHTHACMHAHTHTHCYWWYLVLRKIGQRLVSILNHLPSEYDIVSAGVHQTLHTIVLACWEQRCQISIILTHTYIHTVTQYKQ